MLRISLPWILEVMASIDQLAGVANMNRGEAKFLCRSAVSGVQTIFEQSIYAPYLKSSREKATTLIEILKPMSTDYDDDKLKELPFTAYEASSVRYHREQFRSVFFAELSGLPSFLVTGKGGYDINTLIDEGQKLFPELTLSKCPEAESDMREAGKALAFELATSCGFHVFRVTESVLKRYWDHVSDGKDRLNFQTIGSYAKELESKKLRRRKDMGDSQTARQLAPQSAQSTPDANLTVEDAIATLGIARSVIAAMLRVMPDIPSPLAHPTLTYNTLSDVKTARFATRL